MRGLVTSGDWRDIRGGRVGCADGVFLWGGSEHDNHTCCGADKDQSYLSIMATDKIIAHILRFCVHVRGIGNFGVEGGKS